MAGNRGGLLTNGRVESSYEGLLAHFRRCHQRHHEDDDVLYRRGALALRRLKRAADGRQTADRHVWLALAHRLREYDHEVAWMYDHVTIRCPDCHGRLAFVAIRDGPVLGRCGTNCDGLGGDRLEAIRSLLASLYAAAFDEETPSPEQFLQI
ncbi:MULTISPECIES: hypothetical protein [Halomicrobium]|uniref:hypothetical protein n=1 Tax=Halomicrobium TaxID=203135 RepID=UPI00019BC04F|nr:MULTISPECIES: hypothetical protein [Halomicrobium]